MMVADDLTRTTADDLDELERLLTEMRAAIEAGLTLIESRRGALSERD